MKNNNYRTKLSIQCVFGIPKDCKHTDDQLNTLMGHFVHKFHAMATHLPDLPEHFALIMAEYDDNYQPSNILYAAWIRSIPEEAYLMASNSPIKIYDLEVVSLLGLREFEVEKIYSPSHNKEMISHIILKKIIALN